MNPRIHAGLQKVNPMLLQSPIIADAATGHCPNCGGGRKLGAVSCDYCGSALIDPVDESAVTAALAEIERDRHFGLLAMRGQNFSEAEWRFGRILESCLDDIDAWICKGHAVGMQSNVNGDRLQESLVYFEQALTLAEDDETCMILESIDNHAGLVGTHAYGVMRTFAQEHVGVKSTHRELQERADAVLCYLWAIHRRTTTFSVTLTAIAGICTVECRPLCYDGRAFVPTKARKTELKQHYDRATNLLRAIAPDFTPSKFDEPTDADGFLGFVVGLVIVLGASWVWCLIS